MARQGRKRKPGKRYASGDLVRSSAVDRGTPESRLQRARGCGQIDAETAMMWSQGMAADAIELVANDCLEGMDAIGRAWVAGLLEVEGSDSGNMLRAGRHLALLYWDNYTATDSKTGAIEPRIRSSEDANSKRAASVDRQLNARMEALSSLPAGVTRAISQLCLSHHYDAGPAWLDRLIALRANGSDYAQTEDWAMMRLALMGLAALT